MDKMKWIRARCPSLKGKTVAVTGATGGLGRQICRYVLALGGELIPIGREPDRTAALCRELQQEFPGCSPEPMAADFLCLSQVTALEARLRDRQIHILCLNAGSYCMERAPAGSGWDPVFQINFLAQYHLAQALLPGLQALKGRVAVMGSIAAGAVRTDPGDPDFSGRRSPEAVYGNSKRYLMYGLQALAARYPGVTWAAAHPGITPTGITRNYPAFLRALIRWPMRLTFCSPAGAARAMMLALTEPVPGDCWAGPGLFSIWGAPKWSPMGPCTLREKEEIFAAAEKMRADLTSGSAQGSKAEICQA